MRLNVAAAFVVLVAQPALAQAPPAPQAAFPYERSPWWMREPIIAATGHVRTELRANRANFSTSFQAVDRTAPAATKAAADKVKALAQALQAYGADTVRVATTFNMRPLYDQYKDSQGRLQENQRADQVERYQVDANVQIEVRDMAVLERVYAAVIAARPTATAPVFFRLEPDNETRTEMFKQAVADANRRGRLAVEAAGARLGAVKLIDPTGRACETDVLVAGAGRGGGDTPAQEVMVTASRRFGAPPPPPPPPPSPSEAGQRLTPEDAGLPLQPPLQSLDATACVVYALGPGGG